MAQILHLTWLERVHRALEGANVLGGISLFIRKHAESRKGLEKLLRPSGASITRSTVLVRGGWEEKEALAPDALMEAPKRFKQIKLSELRAILLEPALMLAAIIATMDSSGADEDRANCMVPVHCEFVYFVHVYIHLAPNFVPWRREPVIRTFVPSGGV